jgi:hypothetical protein
MKQAVYQFAFEQAILNSELKQLFYIFVAQDCFCKEQPLFLEAFNKYKSINESPAKEQRFKDIVAKFVAPASRFELNLSHQVRNQILDSTDQEKADHALSVAADIVLLELKDNFTRFTHSDVMKKFIERQSESQMLQFAKVKFVEKEKVIQRSDIVFESWFTKKDLTFVLDQAEDSVYWKLLSSGPSNATFASRNKFVLGDKGENGIRLLKVTGIVPYSIKQVLHVITSPQCKLQYDNNLSSTTSVDYLNRVTEDTWAVGISYESFPAIWPLTNRDMVLANTCIYQADAKRYIILQKSTTHDKVPERKGSVRATVFTGWIIQFLHDSKTRYTKISYNDMKVTTGKSIWKNLLKKRAQGLHKGLLSVLQQNPVPQQQNTCQLMQTLEENNVPLEYFWDKKVEAIKRSSNNFPTPQFNGKLKRIIYVSRCDPSLSKQELNDIASKSIANNKQLNVTGILLYTTGVFYQVIEGEESVINSLYHRIQQDHRHFEVITAKEELDLTESERQFSSWSMNTVNLDEDLQDNVFAQTMRKMIQLMDKHQAFEDEKLALDLLENDK